LGGILLPGARDVEIFTLSFRSTNWVLQWGPTGAGRFPGLSHSGGPTWRLDFHLPPRPRGGHPLHLVKGEIWFQTLEGRRSPRVTTSTAKWITQGIYLHGGPRRWAHRGGFGPTGWVAYQGDPAAEVVRPGRQFDYTRGGYPLRGTRARPGWFPTGGEDHLVRPRYV